jgi:Bacterial SH3 domain/PEGA domain
VQTVDITSTQVETRTAPAGHRIFWFIGILFITLVLALSVFLTQYFFGPPATLQITTTRGTGSVKVDNYFPSPVLYKIDLRPGSHEVTVSDDTHAAAPWKSSVTLTHGTLTSIDLDLGPSAYFTSSVTLSLTRGNELSIKTNPDKAQVFLDEDNIGIAPVSRRIPSPGVHTISIKKDNYIDKTFQINVTNGFSLLAEVTLFKNPSFPITSIKTASITPTTGPDLSIISREESGISNISGTLDKPSIQTWSSAQLFNLNAPDSTLPSAPSTWAKGIYYHALNHLRLVDLPFQYLIDESGKIYEGRSGGKNSVTFDPGASLENIASAPTLKPGIVMVGYLGQKGNVKTAALDSFTKLIAWLGRTGPSPMTPQIKILHNNVGFLRVRKSPSTSSMQMTTVKPGDTYNFVTEQNNWTEIELPDGTTGWVESAYIQKI